MARLSTMAVRLRGEISWTIRADVGIASKIREAAPVAIIHGGRLCGYDRWGWRVQNRECCP
jgi:hypothetical protein